MWLYSSQRVCYTVQILIFIGMAQGAGEFYRQKLAAAKTSAERQRITAGMKRYNERQRVATAPQRARIAEQQRQRLLAAQTPAQRQVRNLYSAAQRRTQEAARVRQQAAALRRSSEGNYTFWMEKFKASGYKDKNAQMQAMKARGNTRERQAALDKTSAVHNALREKEQSIGSLRNRLDTRGLSQVEQQQALRLAELRAKASQEMLAQTKAINERAMRRARLKAQIIETSVKAGNRVESFHRARLIHDLVSKELADVANNLTDAQRKTMPKEVIQKFDRQLPPLNVQDLAIAASVYRLRTNKDAVIPVNTKVSIQIDEDTGKAYYIENGKRGAELDPEELTAIKQMLASRAEANQKMAKNLHEAFLQSTGKVAYPADIKNRADAQLALIADPFATPLDIQKSGDEVVALMHEAKSYDLSLDKKVRGEHAWSALVARGGAKLTKHKPEYVNGRLQSLAKDLEKMNHVNAATMMVKLNQTAAELGIPVEHLARYAHAVPELSGLFAVFAKNPALRNLLGGAANTAAGLDFWKKVAAGGPAAAGNFALDVMPVYGTYRQVYSTIESFEKGDVAGGLMNSGLTVVSATFDSMLIVGTAVATLATLPAGGAGGGLTLGAGVTLKTMALQITRQGIKTVMVNVTKEMAEKAAAMTTKEALAAAKATYRVSKNVAKAVGKETLEAVGDTATLGLRQWGQMLRGKVPFDDLVKTFAKGSRINQGVSPQKVDGTPLAPPQPRNVETSRRVETYRAPELSPQALQVFPQVKEQYMSNYAPGLKDLDVHNKTYLGGAQYLEDVQALMQSKPGVKNPLVTRVGGDEFMVISRSDSGELSMHFIDMNNLGVMNAVTGRERTDDFVRTFIQEIQDVFPLKAGKDPGATLNALAEKHMETLPSALADKARVKSVYRKLMQDVHAKRLAPDYVPPRSVDADGHMQFTQAEKEYMNKWMRENGLLLQGVTLKDPYYRDIFEVMELGKKQVERYGSINVGGVSMASRRLDTSVPPSELGYYLRDIQTLLEGKGVHTAKQRAQTHYDANGDDLVRLERKPSAEDMHNRELDVLLRELAEARASRNDVRAREVISRIESHQNVDPVTGLLSATYFNKHRRGEDLFHRQAKPGDQITEFGVDVANFGSINNKISYEAADAHLADVGALLQYAFKGNTHVRCFKLPGGDFRVTVLGDAKPVEQALVQVNAWVKNPNLAPKDIPNFHGTLGRLHAEDPAGMRAAGEEAIARAKLDAISEGRLIDLKGIREGVGVLNTSILRTDRIPVQVPIPSNNSLAA